jgi:hypothetical protein
MRKFSVGRVLAVVVLALLVAGPVFAQDKDIVVAGGWAPTYVFANGANEFAPIGLMLNVGVPVVSNVQIVGDFGWNYKNSEHLVTGTGGVRYVVSQGKGKPAPFVEGLAGLGYVNGGPGAGFAFGVGGGVDVPLSSNAIAVRAQINYFRLQISGVGFNSIRFGIGISTAAGSK